MRLWTVQPILVLERLRTEGSIYVDPYQINDVGWIHPQYRWLTWQLQWRIKDSRGHPPWWAYCKRPDLRWVRHSRPRGSREVLIEFEPPTDAFVSFPIWAWNDVYCSQYLSFTGKEAKSWEKRLKNNTGIEFGFEEGLLPEPWQEELEVSWRRLFSPRLPARSWHRGLTSTDREAVTDVIKLEWILSTREFMGTGAY